MQLMRKIISICTAGLFLLAILISLIPVSVAADTTLPQEFYGIVKINNADAPAGGP